MDAFVSVLRRFPLVMTAAAVGTVTSMILIERTSNSADEDAYAKILMACSLGLTTLLCSALVAEKWKLSGFKQLLPHFVALALVVLYYLSLVWGHDFDSALTPVRFMGLNLAAHLGVAFIPYLDSSSVEDFWEYNKRLFGNFMVGAFYSLVIFAGLSVAILAVNELFNLDIDEKIYGHLFAMLAGIFNTTYFLAHFPKEFNFSVQSIENQEIAPPSSPYTTAFKNLTKFILIPIVAIYFLILYAFSAKILVTWELPQGWVGKLVLGFSVAGIFTYLLNYLLVKFDDSFVVKGFRRWFFYILLPMVVLLFVAIGRRISDYGVTEARYVVAISGVWLLLMSLYFVVSKKDNIKFIPISLAFFCLFTVLGPFNAFKASERSQLGRFRAVLEKNKLLKDGKAVVAVDSISREDGQEIRAGFEFFRGREQAEDVAGWFGVPVDTVNDWSATFNLLKKYGIPPNDYQEDPTHCNVYFNQLDRTNNGVDVKGFDRMFTLNSFAELQKPRDFTGFFVPTSTTSLLYYENDALVDSFSLMQYLKLIESKDACNNAVLPDSLAIYEISTPKFELRMILEVLEFHRGTNWRISGVNGKVLLHKKQ